MKFENLCKKLSEQIKRNHGDASNRITAATEQSATLLNHINRMSGTLEVWDGKIRRMDNKMHSLSELAQMLEDNGIK